MLDEAFRAKSKYGFTIADEWTLHHRPVLSGTMLDKVVFDADGRFLLTRLELFLLLRTYGVHCKLSIDAWQDVVLLMQVWVQWHGTGTRAYRAQMYRQRGRLAKLWFGWIKDLLKRK